ncbi:hypothetical protein ACSVIJ_05365 [Pseudomonas sp. NCHU5208]|uniref:hypothetical protein n=1 Tax=unclassified Pseudomonas TaxID=196821 RepID=UPI003F9D207B
MGATVSTGKLAAAFRDTDGVPFYLLFEETYEKNVFPHTPRWSCYAMGRLQHVMAAVFRAGAACEGGSLQGSGGRIVTSSGYIAGWLKELANPVEFSDMLITLEVSDSFYATVPSEKLEPAVAALVGIGRSDVADALSAGESIELSLHAEADLFAALGNVVAPWRLIGSGRTPLHRTRRQDLGYDPAKTKAFDLPSPKVFRISDRDDSLLMLGEDKCWRCVGWQYSVISEYVRAYGEVELREPVTYRSRIKAFRNALASAPVLPGQLARIIIDTTVELPGYLKSSIERAAGAFPHTITDGVFQLEVDLPLSDDQLWVATNLPKECTTWEFMTAKATQKPAPVQQLSLLAG